MNARVLAIGLLTICCIGCVASHPAAQALPMIHPRAFSMVECWLSDTAEPVVTEISLDAVRNNRNQFDYEDIVQDGEWVRVDGDDGWGYDRYRVLGRNGDSYVVEFLSNGGGSFTSRSRIKFTLFTRRIEVDGIPKQVQVIRINSMDRDK